MSRQLITTARFLLFVLGITAVLTLTVHAAPTVQEAPHPRLNLEGIPHQPASLENGQPTESVLSIAAPDVFLSWSKVTFQTYRNGSWDVYISNDDGSGQTAVASGGKAEIHPHLNRGNTKIVYASNSGGDYEIYTMNIDGSSKTALTNNSTSDGNPSWSPDGSKIAFEAYRNGEADIYVMNANGTNQVRLTTDPDFDGMPTWSPDGSKIAFVSRRTGGYRIYVMNADGSGQTQISNQPYSLRPQWSPDGSQIAYDADNDGDGWQDLWRMNADGTNQTLVHNPSGQTDAWASGWSPDGNYITYTLISFIQYQGNWYWTQAFLYGVSLTGSYRIVGSTDGRDWDAHWQTSDNIIPTSYVKAMPPQSPGPIPVSWSSSDGGGSGIKNYDVQVKIGAGNWSNWLVDTTDTSAFYPGIGGQSYAFRVRASDNSFNNESYPASADTATTVENMPPISFITALPNFARFDENLAVSWAGSDPGYSGIQTYDVQYRVNNGSWVNWQTAVESTTAVLNGALTGDVYDFRVRALDKAQNQGNWSTGADSAKTTFYTWGIEGFATDNAGAPVSNVVITTNPPLLGQSPSDIDGSFGGYIETANSSYDVSWSKANYTTLPFTEFSNGTDGEYAVVMPPTSNVITDWGFESGDWNNGWQQGGTVSATITDSISHSGQYAALLGQLTTFDQGIVPNLPDDVGYHFNMDDANIGHLIFFSVPANGFSYQQLNPDTSWSPAEFVTLPSNFQINYRPEAVFEENGRIHLFWLSSSGPPDYNVTLNHIERDLGGQWTTPESVTNVSFTNYPIFPAVDSFGNIHLLYIKRAPVTNDDELYYISRINNNWSTPLKISVNDYFAISSDVESFETNIQIGSDGKVYVVWVENVSGLNLLFYKERHPVNGWQPTIRLVPGFTNPDHTFYHMEMLIDDSDNLYLFWENIDTGGGLFFLEKRAGTDWLAPIQLNSLGNAIWPQYAVSANGELFLTYFTVVDGEDKLFLHVRDRMGIWQAPRELRQETADASQDYIMGQMDLDVDASGTLHIVWSEIIDPNTAPNTMEYQVIYARKQWVGKPEVVEAWSGTGEANSFYFPPRVFAHNSGQPTLLWLANSNAPLHYSTPQASNVSGTYAFSTEFTVPSALSNPILSFLYDLSGAFVTQGETFNVSIDDGTQVSTILVTSTAASWRHFWFDMSPWAGQTVTLTFEFSEAANSSVSHVAIDEVTLGTSYPDLWIANSQESGGLGERVVHTITFGNQGGGLANDVTIVFNLPAGLAYRGSSLTPTSVSAQEITWQVGDLIAKSQVQTIEIELEILPSAPSFSSLTSQVDISTGSAELEMLNNSATGTIYIGKEMFLPVIFIP